MRSYTDNKGEKWALAITLGDLRRIRALLAIDLFDPVGWQEMIRSFTVRLACVWYLCQKQAEERGLSEEQWEERLMGDGIAQEASIEFLCELSDFFRRMGQDKMARLNDVQREVMEKAMKHSRDNPEEMDRLIGKMRGEAERTLGIKLEELGST